MTDTSLLQDFITESVEHLEDMETKLLQLESDPKNSEILNDIFRSIHTIKGASDYMGMERIAELSHKLENLLDLIRKDEIVFTGDILDTLMTARDRIVLLIGDLELTQSEETTIDDVLTAIKNFIDNPGGSDPDEASSETTEKISETSYNTEIMEEFISEARECLDEMEANLSLMESDPENKEAFNELFRAIHTIKGAADYMGIERIAALSKQVESFLLKIRQEEMTPDIKAIQLIAAVPKRIALLIEELEQTQTEETEIDNLSTAIRYLSEKAEDADSAADDMMIAEDGITEEDVPVEQNTKEDNDDLFDDEYNEEYDEELFDIFLEQLQESIFRLREVAGEMLYAGNQVEPVLEKYIDCIQGLYSSANYMGYEKLANYYEKWTEELYVLLEAGHPGEGLDWQGYIETKINSRINKIIKIFPQLQVGSAVTDVVEENIIDVNKEPADIFEKGSVLGKEADEIAAQAKLSDMDTDIGQIDSDMDESDRDEKIGETNAFDDGSVLGEEAGLIAISDDEIDLDEEGVKIAEATDKMDMDLVTDQITEDMDEFNIDIADDEIAEVTDEFGFDMEDDAIDEVTDEFGFDMEDDEIAEITDEFGFDMEDDAIAEVTDEFDMEDDAIAEVTDEFDMEDDAIAEVTDEFDMEDDAVAEVTDEFDMEDDAIAEVTDEFDMEDDAIAEVTDEFDMEDDEIAEVIDEFDMEDDEIAEVIDVKSSDIAQSEINIQGSDIAQSKGNLQPEDESILGEEANEIISNAIESVLDDDVDQFVEDEDDQGGSSKLRNSREQGSDIATQPEEEAIATADEEDIIFTNDDVDVTFKLSQEAEDSFEDLDVFENFEDDQRRRDSFQGPEIAQPTTNNQQPKISNSKSATQNQQSTISTQGSDTAQPTINNPGTLYDKLETAFDHFMNHSLNLDSDAMLAAQGNQIWSSKLAVEALFSPTTPQSQLIAPSRTNINRPPNARTSEPEWLGEEMKEDAHPVIFPYEQPAEPHHNHKGDPRSSLFSRPPASFRSTPELAKSDIEPKPEPKIEPKPKPMIEPKPEPKIEPKPEPRIEPKPPALRNIEKNKTLRKSKQYENIKNKKKASPKAQINPPKAQIKPKGSDKAIKDQSKVGSTMDAISKKSIRVDAKKIDDLINQVGELVVSRAWFSQLYSEMRIFQQFLKEKVKLDQKNMKQVRGITFRLSEATVALGRVANELQEGVMRVRMLPIAQLFNRYPRLVRDLTHNSDKKVRLEVKGEDTELDKMIIEEISDPLIHIIRNAVDHGIETATERRRANKTEAGRLILEAYHESNHVVIEVSDNGRGINPEKIKATAIKRELLGADELNLMPDKELTALITIPGFSTAAQVTTTSGRGVGMDVVKKNIEKLNGTLEIDSKVGAYTRFRIKIPLTLAIIPALLVKVGVELYTIPLAAVEETLRIYSKDTTTIEGTEVIYVRNMTLPLVRLSEIFGIPSRSDSGSKEFVVIVNTGLKKIGLVVDALIGQEEVVIKPLEDYLQEKSGFSGATILGDGRISLILDVYELANISIKRLISKRKVRI